MVNVDLSFTLVVSEEVSLKLVVSDKVFFTLLVVGEISSYVGGYWSVVMRFGPRKDFACLTNGEVKYFCSQLTSNQ